MKDFIHHIIERIMSAIVSKATGLVNSVVTKSTELANCAVYWGKVGAEIGKVVYKAEGLAPPSQQQFTQVYKNAFEVVKSQQKQKELLSKASSFTLNKQNAVKAAVYGTQLLAFFSVGEIIGRRSLFGYPVAHHGEHH